MLISLEDITIRVGDRYSFANTSWEIQREETWAVCGPTGSGKSTLVKALSRQLPLSSGKIHYYFDPFRKLQGRSYILPGEILTFSSETHQQFFQSFAHYHQARWQSFEGETAPDVAHLLNRAFIHTRSPNELANEADQDQFDQQKAYLLDLFGIEYLLQRKAHLLSHGESRKVYLTRLLLQAPKLLILEDPFSGFDEDTHQRFRQNIDHLLRNHNSPVMLTTPRADEVPAAVTHIIYVEHHKVALKGPRSLIIEKALPATHESRVVHDPTQNAAFLKMVDQYAAVLNLSASTMCSEFIKMKDIQVSYSSADVLNNITWAVRQGERWALSGPNGAGKTTLLSLILADHPQAYSNSISLFGRVRGSGESIWDIKQKIGWVSPELQVFYNQQSNNLEVVSSGFFHSVGLYRHCTQEQVLLARMWMQAFGIDTIAEKPFRKISTGQQRLVLLARAVVKNPPLLILDEPCAGLDDTYRHAFTTLIEQLCARTPLTLVYVTHNPAELPRSITHHLVLDQGSVIRMT